MQGRARFRPVGIVALAVLLIAACGGGGGGGATAVAGGAGTTVATPAATATGPTTAASAASPTASAAPATSAAATSASTPTATAPDPPGGSASPRAASPVASPAGGASPAATTAERYVIVPDKSEASYRVQETFFGIGLNTAIGRTNTISGELFIDRQRLSASRIGPMTVDISKLKSDEMDRDDNIRQNWLESAKYPQATFVTKRLEGLPDGPYTEGQEFSFKIVGDLTVRTVTKEVTWDATGKIVGGVFTGTATTNFNMTDFGFDPPEIARTLKAENGVIVEMKIEAQRAP